MKRLIDFVLALLALCLLSPVILVVAWKIKNNLGSPILFRQTRPGLGGRPFEMIKFRTMKDAVDSNGKQLPDSERLTPFGNMLRSTSLDELPELWNVLKGDMSLVGPRPLLMEYLPLYSKEQSRRHEVRPGVTGWAQINGRNAISWEEKFNLDVWYVDNRSFSLDIKILFSTVKKVFVREGISSDDHATMPLCQCLKEIKMKNNVLILSAGRRGELVQDFRQDLLKHFPDGKVFCTDMYPELSAACQLADKAFKVPRVTSVDYLDKVLAICLDNNIGLVVPTIDTELLLLSHARDNFLSNGIHLIISDSALVELCRDKRRTAELFNDLNIDQPAIYSKNNLSFPCFCKPYDGSCSIGAFPVTSKDELTQDILNDPKNMFMELIPKSYCEYTVDAYYSSNGELTCLTPRKRVEVRGGEVSKGATRKNFVYDYLIQKLAKLPGARGCITFQFFVNEQEEKVKGLEINPRFGGGYPLTYSSGACFPSWLIQEYLLGYSIDFFDNWEKDLMMLRYDAKVLVHG